MPFLKCYNLFSILITFRMTDHGAAHNLGCLYIPYVCYLLVLFYYFVYLREYTLFGDSFLHGNTFFFLE